MKCSIDGDYLCITKDDFINLQESVAIFIPLTQGQIREINVRLIDSHKCPDCESTNISDLGNGRIICHACESTWRED